MVPFLLSYIFLLFLSDIGIIYTYIIQYMILPIIADGY